MSLKVRILASVLIGIIVPWTPYAFADVLWTEDAESGTTYVLDGTDPIYTLIQSDIVSQGSNAFHLANPYFQDNWFEIDQTLTIQSDTKLFFTSRLNWATPTQVAKVQISTNSGASWPTDIFNQLGNDSAGEGSFGLKEIDLSGYNNQQLRFRFMYDHIGGTAFTQTATGVGWHVDNIQIADQFQKELYSIGDPTAYEQQFLEYLNRARADALVEANRLAAETDPDILSSYSFFGVTGQNIIDQFTWYVNNGVINQVAQPLAFNADLLTAAQLHTQDQFDNQFQGHLSSSYPPSPFLPGYELDQRVEAFGYNWTKIAENVFSYADSVAQGHAGFDVDWGDAINSGDPDYNPAFNGQGMQNPAGHRRNIHNADFKEVGIGVINGMNGSVGPQLVTQDFGNPGDATFITGVVYDDMNENNFYDIGEGQSGVRVDVEGSAFFAISSSSGGYTVPVTGDGSYGVTFSGGGFASFFSSANVISGNNVKIDYMVASITYAADFDGDNDVDDEDLARWTTYFGASASADADDDGDTDGSDFLIWQRQYGSGIGATAAAVPEPSSIMLLLAAFACNLPWRRLAYLPAGHAAPVTHQNLNVASKRL